MTKADARYSGGAMARRAAHHLWGEEDGTAHSLSYDPSSACIPARARITPPPPVFPRNAGHIMHVKEGRAGGEGGQAAGGAGIMGFGNVALS